MFVRITNTPRDYAWGSRTAIAELLGTDPSGGPEAELWLGAHPGSPSRIVEGAPEPDLAAWAAAHRADGRLPFLMKVLAASAPLSLQAHPTIAQAVEGFARENAAGIPVDAPERNYKDELHKPELTYALSDPFIALAGFRPVAEARAALDAALTAVPGPPPALDALRDRLTDDVVLPDVVRWLIEGGPAIASIVDALTAVARALEGDAHDTPGWATVRRLADHYPGDPGIALSLLMHTVVLRPGEALYLPTGNIHSYQQGLAIEVMAASDNVLRGGLTPKHVDVPELMRVLDARPLPAPYLAPVELAPGVRRFAPDVPDFALTVVDAGAAVDGVVAGEGPAIALCLGGSVTAEGGPTIARGEALFVDAGPLVLRGDGNVVVATTG